MTKTSMDLSELLAKHDQGDFLRSVAEAVLQPLMEADVERLIGAGRHERAENRTTWRNDYRERADEIPCAVGNRRSIRSLIGIQKTRC